MEKKREVFLNEDKSRMREETIQEREALLRELDALKKRYHEEAQRGGKDFSKYLLKVESSELYQEDLFMYWLLAHEIPKRIKEGSALVRDQELREYENDFTVYKKKKTMGKEKLQEISEKLANDLENMKRKKLGTFAD